MKTYNFSLDNKKDLKSIIFDFDETLYYNPLAQESYFNYLKKALLDLTNYNEDEITNIIKLFGFDLAGERRVSVSQNCSKIGIMQEDWIKYRTEHFYPENFSHIQTINNALMRSLLEKYKLFLVSSEYLDNVHIKASQMNIDLSIFSRIYASDGEKLQIINKQEAYKDILQSEGLVPSQVIVIGDRYNVDIKPFEEIGGGGVQITNTDEVEGLIKQLLK